MASIPGNKVELFATSLEDQAVTDISAVHAAEDSQLVEAARQGDRAAFGRLYHRYARMVHGILLARAPLNEVDDLVQDVFLLALPRLQSLRDSNRFGAWLAAIARNRANDYHRQSVDEVELPEDLPDGEDRERMTGGAPDAEAASILGIIRTLPETYRETLLLRLVEGMTGPEIAQRTGLTPGSVRVNLHRGMQQLRQKLSAPAKAVEE
ncbi:MAG TPA: sigma-70 family RNA polymerase sigma factor [Candidatus Angelobacter sp.]